MIVPKMVKHKSMQVPLFSDYNVSNFTKYF